MEYEITLPKIEEGYRYKKPSKTLLISQKDLFLIFPPRLRQKIRVFFRDNFRCQVCGKNKKLNIHHWDKNPKNNNINNMSTLCFDCHIFYHKHGFL